MVVGEVDNYKFPIVTKINDHLVWWDPASRGLHTIWFWVERERDLMARVPSPPEEHRSHIPLWESE